MKPLWQLLLHIKDDRLTCSECFAILEYMADLSESEDVDHQAIIQATQQHIKTCPDCQKYYQHQMDELKNVRDDE
ncbi:MAG: hypothetical protein ACE5FD_05675 [Anaerolineae bacterium]